MKSLREVLEMVGLEARIGIARGKIVLSIVEDWYALKLSGDNGAEGWA